MPPLVRILALALSVGAILACFAMVPLRRWRAQRRERAADPGEIDRVEQTAWPLCVLVLLLSPWAQPGFLKPSWA